MKFYVQVQRAGAGGQWKQVNAWTNEGAAIQDAQHAWGNPDNPQSRGVMTVRVVKGRRKPEVAYERMTS